MQSFPFPPPLHLSANLPVMPPAPPSFRSSPGLAKGLALVQTRAFPFWLFLGLLYGQLALALIPSWSDGTYYDYGFLVPFLVPAFFLARWKESAPDTDSLTHSLRQISTSLPMALLLLLGLAGITLLRLIQGADSGWRPPLYLHALVILGITFVLLYRLQGKSAFTYWPCAIILLMAIPLPSALEFSLIRNLTTGVVEFALFVNRMMGLPLESSGETIFANGIPLHVSDGCSGIRSFQSGVFAGFVLGEYLRLSMVSRGLLVASSLGIAFLMNGFRVIYLVQHAVAYPGADLQKVHDISGYFSLTATFLLIGAGGWLLGRMERKLSTA